MNARERKTHAFTQPAASSADNASMYTDDLSITLWLWALSRAPAEALVHVLQTLPCVYGPRGSA